MTFTLGLESLFSSSPVVSRLKKSAYSVPLIFFDSKHEWQDNVSEASSFASHHGQYWFLVRRSYQIASSVCQLIAFGSIPAEYAVFPSIDRILTRLSNDDEPEANLSTFASEMKVSSFILSLASRRSLVIIDEVGVGRCAIILLLPSLNQIQARNIDRGGPWCSPRNL